MKIKRQFNKDYVCKVFRELYFSKWESKPYGNKQQDFADAIVKIQPDAKCDNKNVSKWLNGTPPLKYLPAICKIFDVGIDEFIPRGHDDRYHYSSEFADGLEKELERRATLDFGIDLTFLQGLKNIIPGFDSRFPLVAPLVFREGDSEGQYYKRAVPEWAAKTTINQGLLQLTRDGKCYFMTIWDLKIIKVIQDQTAEFIKNRLDQISADLVKREKDAIAQYIKQNDDIWVLEPLSDEQKQKIDPYGFYTESERKKYHLPDDKKIFREQEANINAND